jgi:hypothetical protein
MWKYIIFQVYVLWFMVDLCHSTSSPIPPFIKYNHAVELQQNISDLWWTTDDVNREITFELHMKTTGWIALGISPGKTFENSR